MKWSYLLISFIYTQLLYTMEHDWHKAHSKKEVIGRQVENRPIDNITKVILIAQDQDISLTTQFYPKEQESNNFPPIAFIKALTHKVASIVSTPTPTQEAPHITLECHYNMCIPGNPYTRILQDGTLCITTQATQAARHYRLKVPTGIDIDIISTGRVIIETFRTCIAIESNEISINRYQWLGKKWQLTTTSSHKKPLICTIKETKDTYPATNINIVTRGSVHIDAFGEISKKNH